MEETRLIEEEIIMTNHTLKAKNDYLHGTFSKNYNPILRRQQQILKQKLN